MGELPKLLVIGARGFLGTFLGHRAGVAFQVVRGDRTIDAGADTDVVIDVTDGASVARAFAEVRPDAVVLLAAISDIDRCQREPKLATEVNLYGAERVANECARVGARLLFTSTGAVFDGRKHGYREEDEVTPISVYGKTKAQAEQVVASLLPSAVIARVSLVLGRTGKATTNSVVDTLVRRWEAGEAVTSSVVEKRNPIDAGTLSEWFVELLRDERQRGLFHTGCTDQMTRYEMARAMAHYLRIPEVLVEPELLPKAGRAPRGVDHWLLVDKIASVCATRPPTCEEVIERSLHEVAKGSVRAGV